MLTKEELPACPVATTVQLIGSKWKLLILRNLMARPWRFKRAPQRFRGYQPEGPYRQPPGYGRRRDHYQNGLSGSAAESRICPFPSGRIYAPYPGRHGRMGNQL